MIAEFPRRRTRFQSVHPEQNITEISTFFRIFTDISSQNPKNIKLNVPFGAPRQKKTLRSCKVDHIFSTNVRTQTFQRATESSRQPPLQFSTQVTLRCKTLFDNSYKDFRHGLQIK